MSARVSAFIETPVTLNMTSSAKYIIELDMMVRHFGASADRVSIIPNAVGQRFFDATPALFEEKFGIAHPFVVCSASVSPGYPYS